MRGDQSHSRESWKTTLEIQGASLKTSIMMAKRKLNLRGTLSWGKKKGDKVEDEDDDDEVGTIVSQDRVTATLCTEELFLITQYI
jgi:hypothetical protein